MKWFVFYEKESDRNSRFVVTYDTKAEAEGCVAQLSTGNFKLIAVVHGTEHVAESTVTVSLFPK